jgi:hypothetical protein
VDEDGGTVEGGKKGGEDWGNEGRDSEYGSVDLARGQKQSPQAEHRCREDVGEDHLIWRRWWKENKNMEGRERSFSAFYNPEHRRASLSELNAQF